MSHSRFLSLTSALLLSACGDDSCGIGGAPAAGISASDTDVTLTYTGLTAGPNHDCPVPDAPAGVESLTIMGTQENGPGLFTACVPRPDQLTMPQALGTAMTSPFSLIDLSGKDANGCTYKLDATIPPTGMATADGICDSGTNKAGFALDLDGAASIQQTCGTTVKVFALRLTGRASVLPQ